MKRILSATIGMYALFFLSGCSMLPGLTNTTENSLEGIQHQTTVASEGNDEILGESTTALPEITESSTEPAVIEKSGVYLGVSDYGYTDISEADDFTYRFEIDGKEEEFYIPDSEENGYHLQNKLKEGYNCVIKTEDRNIIDVNVVEPEGKNESVVNGNPGDRTLKNFLTTALMPVGSTLYIYGGGWDWQDKGAAVQATSLGVSNSWFMFFMSKDAGYTYKDSDPAVSYYPYGKFNEYYFAGLDCSGYLGWTLYNTFETENGKEGYVFASTENSKRLADRGWGEFRRVVPNTGYRDETSVCPGDIVSIEGHVWISLGTCKDGSVVIAHSSPSLSRENQPGGGVQIAALGYRGCDAYKIAQEFMSEYYPAWYERYEADLKDPGIYFDFSDERAGIFSWYTDGRNSGLTDPEDFKHMDPKRVLNIIYKGKKNDV